MKYRKIKIICVLILIIISILLINNARKIKDTIILTNNSEMNTFTEEETNNNELEYIEGQAIMITLSNQPMFFNNFRGGSILDELEVVETWEFASTNNTTTTNITTTTTTTVTSPTTTNTANAITKM